METNDLKKIWNTLADNKLIDKKIAKENILEIINNKGKGLLSKIKHKLNIEYWIFLSGIIFIPVVTTFVHILIGNPFATISSYIGLLSVEAYFIIMFLKILNTIRQLEDSWSNLSISESLKYVYYKIKSSKKREYITSLIFGILFISFAMIHISSMITIHPEIDSSGFFSVLVKILGGLLLIFPLILWFEYKIRFSKLTKGVRETIEELNNEIE